jgi:hypothetical protein
MKNSQDLAPIEQQGVRRIQMRSDDPASTAVRVHPGSPLTAERRGLLASLVHPGPPCSLLTETSEALSEGRATIE